MLSVTSFFAKDYVLFRDARLSIEPGLTILRGRNEDRTASSLKSTNAVGKSLLVSALPECRYDAAPLQKSAGRGDVKVAKNGELGFEAVVGGKTIRVVKRASGSTFKTDLYVNGSQTPLAHRKAETLAELQKLFPASDKLYYTTTHLTNRMPGFGTSSPEDRFALFSSFLNADTVAAVAQKISNRLSALSKVKDQADAAQAVLQALPPLQSPPPFHRLALARRLERAQQKAQRTEDGSTAQALYDSLPRSLQDKYPYEVLMQGKNLPNLVQALKQRHAQKLQEEAFAEKRDEAQNNLDALDAKIEDNADCLINHTLMTEALWEDVESGFSGPATRDFLEKKLQPLRDLWDARKDKYEALPPLPTAADVARIQAAEEAFREAGIDPKSEALDADILNYVIEKFPRQCSFLAKMLSNEVSFLKQKKKERDACFEVFSILTSLLTHAQRQSDARALYPAGLSALAAAHKKKEALDAELKEAEDFRLSMVQMSALYRKRIELQKTLDKFPPKTAGANAQSIEGVLKILKQLLAVLPSKSAHTDAQKNQRTLNAARQALAQFDAQKRAAQTQRATQKSLRQAVSAFEAVRDEFEDLSLLKSSFAAKGFKAALLENVVQQYERNLNAVAHLLFEEETAFTCRAEGSSFFIIARRPKVPPCDVRKLSGSEATAFALCNVLALLPILPSNSKTNLLILDEMEEPLDAAMRERFVTLYLPEALRVIPSILCITTKPKDVFSFGALPRSEYLLVRRASQTHLKKA